MSEKECRDFSQYNFMATEELEQILRMDVESGDESDTELILYVMEVLAERKKNSSTQEITAQQAWESFQANYLPAAKQAALTPVPKKAKASTQTWFRRMIASAAVIAVLIFLPVATNAFRWEEVWNAVATWAKDTFSFSDDNPSEGNIPSPSNTRQYTSLQQALQYSDEQANIVPSWLPAGYALKEIVIGQSPQKNSYDAFYSNGEKDLYISVQAFSISPEKVEVGDDPVEVYTINGIAYYIFENVDQIQIIWYIDSYECRISCELTIDEIKMMIDSIGKG